MGAALSQEQINVLRVAGCKVVFVEDDCGARDWEQVPDLNSFMGMMQTRFAAATVNPRTDMIRCAVEDVVSRFIFEIDSETADHGA